MKQNANEKIRNENIKAVFRALSEDKCWTRSDIAEHTGISSVTVGKIVEDLLDAGIFLEKESQSKSVGRHAGHLSIDKSRNIVSVDLSGINFSFSVYDLSMDQVYFIEEEYMEDLTCTEAICRFLHRVKSFMIRESERGRRFMALGIVVPGEYDEKNDVIKGVVPRSFEGIKVRDFVRSMVGIIPDYVMDSTEASLKYCIERQNSDVNTIYINISDGVNVRLVVGGKTVKRSGYVVDRVEGTDNLRLTAELAALTMMNAIGLEHVVVTADIPSDATAVKEGLAARFFENAPNNFKIPDINAMSPHDCACIGMASMLRWEVIEKRIKRLL